MLASNDLLNEYLKPSPILLLRWILLRLLASPIFDVAL